MIRGIKKLMIIFLTIVFTTVPAASPSFAAARRYIVTCNHHYDNKYNTLAKYNDTASAIRKIKAQKKKYRGQWYVWDSKDQKIVWPDLSTKKNKVKKAIAWATAVGNDPRHGYDTEGELLSDGYKLKYKRWGKCGDYGCSPLVETAYELFGYCNLRTISWKRGYTYRASNGRGPFRGLNANNIVKTIRATHKFKDVSAQYAKKGRKMLKPGDVVVNSNQTHTAIIVTKRRIVEGNLNEYGSEFGASRPGDQRGGQELAVSKYMKNYYGFYKGIRYVFRPKT